MSLLIATEPTVRRRYVRTTLATDKTVMAVRSGGGSPRYATMTEYRAALFARFLFNRKCRAHAARTRQILAAHA